MRRPLLILSLLFIVAAGRAAADIVDDIIALAQRNLSTDVIIAFIDHNAESLRDLKAADIARLMDAQVPDLIVEAVLRRQYGMPAEGVRQESPPQEPAPREPRTSQAEETAPQAEPGNYVTYVTDTSYPVPIYYEVPVFVFGADLFGFPHPHRRFDSFHHDGNSFAFNPQPQHSKPQGLKDRLPLYGWTSKVPPSAQSPRPHPGTGQVGRPITADNAPVRGAVEGPAYKRPAPERSTVAPARVTPVFEHSTVAPVRATRTPSQIAPAPVRAPVVRETRSSGPSYSGDSYSRGSASQERVGRDGRR